MTEVTLKKNKEAWLHVCLLVIAIALAYSKLFHAGFMTWDDGEYVRHNKDITGFTGSNIAAWFTKFYIGNYHPLAMLSYAVDYAIGGADPLVYHVTNILLHICNAVLLYFFINRVQPVKTVGFFTAILFALHPAQTETVSWVAERKTLLCAFFYLSALLRYTCCIEKPTLRNYSIVFFLGVAAMLSKAIGVMAPLSLIAVDVWMAGSVAAGQAGFKIRKGWQVKIPLLLVAGAVGWVAILAQENGKFLWLHPEYNWVDTIVFAAYAYVQYILHFLVPVHLSVLYPYPEKTGLLQYLYMVIALGIIVLAFIAYKRKWYILCGGIIFYTVNILLLLQFVQFGEVLMADRYLYISSIGIIFPVVYYLSLWLQKISSRIVAVIAGGVLAAGLLLMTYVRNDIWLSDFNFFEAILEVFPNSAVAQFSVGGLYMRQGAYAEAEKHINLAVEIAPNSYKAWYNKGVLSLREGKPAAALDALNKCLAINEYPKAYFSRALVYQGSGKPDLALADIEKVIEDEPQNARAYFIKGDCLEQQGNVTGAVDNYSEAIKYDSRDPLFYIRRGMIYGKTRQNEAALADLNTAVGISPESGEALYFRGIIKYHASMDPCDDFKAAANCGYKQAQDAIARVCNH